MYILSKNKKAYFDYEILKTMIAGMQLKGYEVKSLKNKHVSFPGSYISTQNEQIWIKNLNIGKYKNATIPDFDHLRTRKLLLHQNEIDELIKNIDKKGITVIPLEIILKNNLLKLKIGIARGKKKYDKREILKKRSLDREIQQKIKHYK